MALQAVALFQRLDAAVSAPIFELKLPNAVETVLAFPDGAAPARSLLSTGRHVRSL